MASKLKRILKWVLAAIVLLAVVILSGLVPLNLSFTHEQITHAVLDSTGVALDIQGDILLWLGPSPQISTGHIILENPDASGPELASMDGLHAGLRLLPLLSNKVQLRTITVSNTRLDLCGTWPRNSRSHSGPSQTSEPVFSFDSLDVNSMDLHCSDQERKFPILPLNLELHASAAPKKPLELKLSGSWEQGELTLQAVGGSLPDLLSDPESFPLELELELPGSRLSMAGSLSLPLSNPRLTTDVQIEIQDPAKLSGLLDIHLPPLLALQATTRLEWGRDELKLDNLYGSLGADSFTGNVQLDLADACPQLQAHLELSDLNTATIANQLEQDWPLSLHLDRGSFDFSSCGNDSQAHRDSFKTSAQINGLRYSINDLEQPLLLDQANFTIASQDAGQLSLNGILHEQAFSAGIELAPLDDIFSGQAWPFTANVTVQGGRFDLDGQALIAGEDSNLDARLSLDIPHVGPVFDWAGIDPDSKVSLKVDSRLVVSGSAMELGQLKLQLGKSDLTGTMGYSSTSGSFAVRAVLRSDLLDLQQIDSLWPTASPDAAASESGTGVERQQSLFADTPLDSILSSVDLDFKVKQIHSKILDMSDIVLDAGIHQGLIENASMSMNLEGIPLQGELDADFRTEPWSMAYKFGAKEVDIAHLLDQLELAQVSDMQADSIDAQASASGSSLVSMVESTELDIVVTNFYWATEDDSGVTQHEFDLEHLTLNLGPEHPTTWKTRGLYNGAKIRAHLKTPAIPATFDKTTPLPLTLIAESGADIFRISAEINRSFDDQLQAEIVVSGQRMESSPDDLADLPETLDDYELHTTITLAPGQVHLADIQARIGSSHLSGDMSLKDQAGKRLVTLDLQGERVETDDFVNLAQQLRELDQANVVDSDGATSKEAGSNEGLFRVLNREIDAISESRVFDIRIDVNDLYSSGEPLGEAHLGLKVDDHQFTLNPMTIALPGGLVEADYTSVEENGRAHAALNIHIDKLEYSGLLRLFSPETKDAGLIYLDTSVQAEAADRASLVFALQGKLDLAVFPEDISAEVLDLWVSNLVFALLPISLGKNDPKKMNCLVARMEIENGKMKPKVAFIDTTDVIVRARGTIDLAEQNLDLLVAPQAKREKFFSISAPLAVTGPFDDFKIGIAPGGLATTMFRWFYGLIYVPFKWLTGERFPADGIETCYKAMDWEEPSTGGPP